MLASSTASYRRKPDVVCPPRLVNPATEKTDPGRIIGKAPRETKRLARVKTQVPIIPDLSRRRNNENPGRVILHRAAAQIIETFVTCGVFLLSFISSSK